MELTQDVDENSGCFHKVIGPRSQNPGKGIKNSIHASAISKKKILAEKNETPFPDSCDLHYNINPQENAMVVSGHPGAPSRVMPPCSKVSKSDDQNAISSDCSHLAPYDPLINYTSPRPEFLRYDPNRRKEILQRIEGEMKKEEGRSGYDWSSSSDSRKITAEESSSVSSTPLQTSFQDTDVQDSKEGVSDAEDDDIEEEGEEVTPWYSKIAWRFLLLLGVLLPSLFYVSFMNYASVPTLKEDGGLEGNYQLIQDGGLDQRAHNPNKFPGNFGGILMGLSSECFDIHSRELTCAIDGFKREVPEEKDLEEGISIICLRNLTEDGKLNEKFPTLEDTARKNASEEMQSFDGTELITERDRDALLEHGTLGGVELVAEELSEEVAIKDGKLTEKFPTLEDTARNDASEEKQSFDGTEQITERDRDTLLENGTLGGVELVAEELSEKVASSDEIEKEPYIEGNPEAAKDAGSEKVEILGTESAKVHNIAQLLKESLQVSETELLSIGSSFGQDALDVCGSFETNKDFGEEAQVMGNSDIDESLRISQSKIAPSISSNNQKLEESEIFSNSDIELKWDSIYLFASKYVLQLLYMLICLLMIIVFNGLHKSFLKVYKISAHESHIPPALKPASEFALEKNNSSVVSVMEEVENKGGDSDVYRMPLTHLNDGKIKFNGVQPPTVELHAEFSVAEGTISGKGSGKKVRRSADSAEESQFFQSQRKISVKNLPSSANKVHPSPLESSLAAEPISTGNSTVWKLQKKKDTGDRKEEVKLVTTPLRRSSRLRNQVTSP